MLLLHFELFFLYLLESFHFFSEPFSTTMSSLMTMFWFGNNLCSINSFHDDGVYPFFHLSDWLKNVFYSMKATATLKLLIVVKATDAAPTWPSPIYKEIIIHGETLHSVSQFDERWKCTIECKWMFCGRIVCQLFFNFSFCPFFDGGGQFDVHKSSSYPPA